MRLLIFVFKQACHLSALFLLGLFIVAHSALSATLPAGQPGPQIISQADPASLPVLLTRDNYQSEVLRIIGLEDEYGQARVDKALAIIKGYDIKSGCRQITYFVWLVRQLP